MSEIDKPERIRNLAIGDVAEFIVANFYDSNWTSIATLSGVIDILDQPRHERVRRAQTFGDDDYAVALTKFLIELFNIDENIGYAVIGRAINEEDLYPDEFEKLGKIMEKFRASSSDDKSQDQNTTPEEFIKVASIPDDFFYKRLISEINGIYASGYAFSLSILIRKLFENLIIDILRRKYRDARIDLYYDTSRGRFHDFSSLLKNLDDNKNDFKYITSELDANLIRRINKYREIGNSSAHSIDVDLTIEKIGANKVDITYLAQFLLRIFSNI